MQCTCYTFFSKPQKQKELAPGYFKFCKSGKLFVVIFHKHLGVQLCYLFQIWKSVKDLQLMLMYILSIVVLQKGNFAEFSYKVCTCYVTIIFIDNGFKLA